MNSTIKLSLGILAVLLPAIVSAQEHDGNTSNDLITWKGSVNLIGDYSTYTPAFQDIPASYGYLHSNQQIAIEGIPFQGYLFLSSYQGSSLNRYSFSFDADALQQTVQERVENKIATLQQIPSIESLQQNLEDLEEPEQYGKLKDLNEKIKDPSRELQTPSAYASILKRQSQLSRFNPSEYSKYEQYLELKSIDQTQDYRKQAKMLKAQGLISSGEALWYNFDAFQVGTTNPYFSDLDLAGLPVKGYFAAYSVPYLYLAMASGTTIPFNLQDSRKLFSRNLQAYKLGSGGVSNTHLHVSYVHGEDADLSLFSSQVANTVGGIDGRLKLFKGKLDLWAKTFLGVYTSYKNAQSETNTIEYDEISKIRGLGEWLSKDVNLNSSTISGSAHHLLMAINDKDLSINGEYRRVDPLYRSVGLAYLQNDVERIQLSIDKFILNKKLRLYGKLRRDEDNLNGTKQFSSSNLNAVFRIRSYFRKLPNLSLTYMPNFYSSTSSADGEIRSHKSQMLSMSVSKAYRFLKMNQVSTGSLTYNSYHLESNTFSSFNSSLSQMVSITKKINTSVQLIYRQTNASYYWSFMPTLKYKIAERGSAHVSFRYGADYFQNTRYAFNIGTRLKINNKLNFGLSIIQNYYVQTSSIADLRVRTSLRATW